MYSGHLLMYFRRKKNLTKTHKFMLNCVHRLNRLSKGGEMIINYFQCSVVSVQCFQCSNLYTNTKHSSLIFVLPKQALLSYSSHFYAYKIITIVTFVSHEIDHNSIKNPMNEINGHILA